MLKKVLLALFASIPGIYFMIISATQWNTRCNILGIWMLVSAVIHVFLVGVILLYAIIDKPMVEGGWEDHPVGR